MFYLIFYALLAMLFAVCMAGLFSVLEDNKPLYTLEKSLIGANPGVACRPQHSTIQYDVDNFTHYIEELREFIKDYKNESWYASKTECTEEDNFGYPHTPCFFIKLNKIYGWKPDFYLKPEMEDMQADLVDFISNRPQVERQQVWISCWEEHTNDTKIEYPWGMGLPGRFYPFLNSVGYISPIVAVKLTPIPNTQIIIRCRAWAKNIKYNKSLKEASGYTRIVLQVDDNYSNATTESSM